MTDRTVVEVTEIVVDPPLVDEPPPSSSGWRSAPRSEQASICARQQMTERSGDCGGVLYYVLDSVILDTAYEAAPTAIFEADGQLRGMIPGDVVGLVVGDVYRVGVVLGLPPSPEEAGRLGHVTLGDDLYLVGVLDKGGSPETNDHEHVPEPLLFDAGEVGARCGRSRPIDAGGTRDERRA